METYFGLESLPKLTSTAVSIGSYDGLHRGHLELINAVKSAAQRSHSQSVVITFDPHPRYVIEGNDCPLQLLSSLDQKIKTLDEIGIDYLVVIPFNEEFSRKSPSDFIEEDIIKGLGAKSIIMGYDHRFGKQKRGNHDLMELMQQRYGVEVIRIDEYRYNGSKVSSTEIRNALQDGNITSATELLGHNYSLNIARCDDGSYLTTEPQSMVPRIGDYVVKINSTLHRVFIGEDRTIRFINPPLDEQEAKITFI